MGWNWNETLTVEWNVDWLILEFSWVCSWHEGICQSQWAWLYELQVYEQPETTFVICPKWAWHLASALGVQGWRERERDMKSLH